MSQLFDDRIEYDFKLPTQKDLPVLILAHPHPLYGGSMENKIIDQVYRRSLEKGWGALRFNFRGVGKSIGSYDEGKGELNDFLDLASHAIDQASDQSSRIILLGYSFGAWIVFQSIRYLKTSLHAVIGVAPPTNLFKFDHYPNKLQKIVFAAENDELAKLPSVKQWFHTLDEPKHLEIVKNADHFFVGHTSNLIKKIFHCIDKTLEYFFVGHTSNLIKKIFHCIDKTLEE
ncbi:MAG: hypothetical protein KDD48_05940 [Bdellovibrionales bacterium]|nr:hypothetical protein [Bdellovibrionales bacterium]